MALFRDGAAARQARADDLRTDIARARRELATVERRARALRRALSQAARWGCHVGAGARFRTGVFVGAATAFLVPFILITLLAGARLPVNAVFVLFQ